VKKADERHGFPAVASGVVRSPAVAALERIEGVLGLSVGPKQKSGVVTGDLALIVHVQRKRPLSRLTHAEIVPTHVDGNITDVQEGTLFFNTSGIVDPKLPGRADTKKYHRPFLRGGIQIRTNVKVESEVTKEVLSDSGIVERQTTTTIRYNTGTLACFAETVERPNAPKQIVGLTCQHVMSENTSKALNRVVGNPGTATSSCCDSFIEVIGSVYDGLLLEDIDASIMVLRDGVQFKQETQGVGPITGALPVPLTNADISTNQYVVQKRGRTTWHTLGVVTTVDAPLGQTRSEDNGRDLRSVRGHTIVTACPPFTCFGAAGDSGSLVTNLDGKAIGVLFGCGGFQGSATPIHVIEQKLDIKILASPAGGGPPQTVPSTNKPGTTPRPDVPATQQPAGANEDPPTRRDRARRAPPYVRPSWARPPDPLLAKASEEMNDTARGREFWETFHRHAGEVYRLLQRNRHVTVAWHRGGGPSIINHGLRCARERGRRMPLTVSDASFEVAVGRILDVFHEHGSEGFRRDIEKYAAMLSGLGGRTYDEIVAELRK